MIDYKLNVFKRASLCRNFDDIVFSMIKNNIIGYPAYLSVGQEYISSSIAEIIINKNIDPDIFIQHRGHATYLSFGGDIKKLINISISRLISYLVISFFIFFSFGLLVFFVFISIIKFL